MIDAAVLPQNVTDSGEIPLPSACKSMHETAAPSTARRPGAGPDNLSALKTGKRAKPARLVDATFPQAAKHAAGKRDAWHRLATTALLAHTGRPLTFSQVDQLRDAARHEAIALLCEHRRRQKGITTEQHERIEQTIAAAIASKQKILSRLGLQPAGKAAASDPYADLYADDPEPEAPETPATASNASALRNTAEPSPAVPCDGEKRA